MREIIKSEYDGLTLRTYLLGKLFISGRLLTRLKQTDGGIKVNGERVTVRYVLHAGDLLELADCDTKANESVEPRDLAICVLFENDDAIVLAKPLHMPTHPSHGHRDDTLANALAFRFRGLPFVFRPINRLDRDTSGVVLVAKNQRAASFFAETMKRGEFKKTYLAVCDGELSGAGTVEKPIKRAEKSIILRVVCNQEDEGAQYAKTEYEVLSSNKCASLVRVSPKTGRTHQIRVHLASLGAPIVGDSLYGRESEHIDRQALHAYLLEFPLPTGGRICIKAPLPEDMLLLLSALGIEKDKI